MAVKGLLINYTEAELLVIKGNCLSQLSTSKNRLIQSSGTNDLSVSKEFGMPLAELLEEVNFALGKKSSSYRPFATRTIEKFRL